MQLLKFFTLFASLAAAAPAIEERDGPSGHEVEIRGIAYAGSGCPAGSVSGQLSSDLTTLTLLYPNYIAEAGKGTSPRKHRSNCQLNVKLKYPQGWQFSISKVEYHGYAYLPKGAKGTCKATYYFSGSPHQISRTKVIYGPYDGNFVKTDVFGNASLIWSPCGSEALLNINSEVRMTPLDSNKPGSLLPPDPQDFQFKQIHYLRWRKCHH